MKTNRMTKFSGIAVLAVLTLCFFIPSVTSASTDLVAYGLVTNVSYVYGGAGYIQAIHLEMENSDMSGYFTYVCRRPNLAPCLPVMSGYSFQFNAHLQSFCYVTGKICGEALIDSLIPID